MPWPMAFVAGGGARRGQDTSHEACSPAGRGFALHLGSFLASQVCGLVGRGQIIEGPFQKRLLTVGARRVASARPRSLGPGRGSQRFAESLRQKLLIYSILIYLI